MFNFSISFKFSGAIVAIMTGALVIISYLNYCNFAKDQQAFVTSRFGVISKDLKGTIEYGLNLGLGLGELKTIQEILEEKVHKQSDINSLQVVNNQGKVFFHSNPVKLQEDTAAYWRQLFQSNDIAYSTTGTTIEDQGNFIQITPLINNFNVKVGSLILSYPKAIIKQPQQDMINFLVFRFAVLSIGFTIIIFLVTSLFFRHFFGKFLRTLENSLHTLLTDQTQEVDPEMAVPDDLKKPFMLFHAKTRNMLVALNEETGSIPPQRSENG